MPVATTQDPLALLQARLDDETEKIAKWWEQPRWKTTKRIYTPRDIAIRRGALDSSVEYGSNKMAQKLFDIFTKHAQDATTSKTFGAMDPVQISQMSKYVDTIYVSGWQCSSTASTSNEPGPDLADYPMDTVPNKVEHLFKAQLFHDRKQNYTLLQYNNADAAPPPPYIDYLRPIIADADAGHGGLSAVFKLVKMFIEKGAAGIHLEDQTSSNKKCGHMAGRCVIPVQEQINRLIMCRMCADIMNHDLILVSRTDSEAATLISSTIDKRDHYFIVGATNKEMANEESFAEMIDTAIANGITDPRELQKLETQWCERANLKLFHEALQDEVTNMENAKEIMENFYKVVGPYTGHSLREQQEIVQGLIGHKLYFDWDICRVKEGLYRYRGGIECAVMRSRSFAPFADLIWMECNYPDYEQAKFFAQQVLVHSPGKWLAYNLSPSFNWSKTMPNKSDRTAFIDKLSKLGYVWQFVTLAGLHTTALAIDKFTNEFVRDGMEAYATTIQAQERDRALDILMHQTWSGAEYIDGLLQLAQNGVNATAAMGRGVTQDQWN